MKKYKVFGDMVSTFYIDVEASSEEEAWDIASAAETHKWTQIMTDSVIETHFVEPIEEDETDLLEDGYPSMANEIVVKGK